MVSQRCSNETNFEEKLSNWLTATYTNCSTQNTNTKETYEYHHVFNNGAVVLDYNHINIKDNSTENDGNNLENLSVLGLSRLNEMNIKNNKNSDCLSKQIINLEEILHRYSHVQRQSYTREKRCSQTENNDPSKRPKYDDTTDSKDTKKPLSISSRGFSMWERRCNSAEMASPKDPRLKNKYVREISDSDKEINKLKKLGVEVTSVPLIKAIHSNIELAPYKEDIEKITDGCPVSITSVQQNLLPFDIKKKKDVTVSNTNIVSNVPANIESTSGRDYDYKITNPLVPDLIPVSFTPLTVFVAQNQTNVNISDKKASANTKSTSRRVIKKPVFTKNKQPVYRKILPNLLTGVKNKIEATISKDNVPTNVGFISTLEDVKKAEGNLVTINSVVQNPLCVLEKKDDSVFSNDNIPLNIKSICRREDVEKTEKPVRMITDQRSPSHVVSPKINDTTILDNIALKLDIQNRDAIRITGSGNKNKKMPKDKSKKSVGNKPSMCKSSVAKSNLIESLNPDKTLKKDTLKSSETGLAEKYDKTLNAQKVDSDGEMKLMIKIAKSRIEPNILEQLRSDLMNNQSTDSNKSKIDCPENQVAEDNPVSFSDDIEKNLAFLNGIPSNENEKITAPSFSNAVQGIELPKYVLVPRGTSTSETSNNGPYITLHGEEFYLLPVSNNNRKTENVKEGNDRTSNHEESVTQDKGNSDCAAKTAAANNNSSSVAEGCELDDLVTQDSARIIPQSNTDKNSVNNSSCCDVGIQHNGDQSCRVSADTKSVNKNCNSSSQIVVKESIDSDIVCIEPDIVVIDLTEHDALLSPKPMNRVEPKQESLDTTLEIIKTNFYKLMSIKKEERKEEDDDVIFVDEVDQKVFNTKKREERLNKYYNDLADIHSFFCLADSTKNCIDRFLTMLSPDLCDQIRVLQLDLPDQVQSHIEKGIEIINKIKLIWDLDEITENYVKTDDFVVKVVKPVYDIIKKKKATVTFEKIHTFIMKFVNVNGKQSLVDSFKNVELPARKEINNNSNNVVSHQQSVVSSGSVHPVPNDKSPQLFPENNERLPGNVFFNQFTTRPTNLQNNMYQPPPQVVPQPHQNFLAHPYLNFKNQSVREKLPPKNVWNNGNQFQRTLEKAASPLQSQYVSSSYQSPPFSQYPYFPTNRFPPQYQPASLPPYPSSVQPELSNLEKIIESVSKVPEISSRMQCGSHIPPILPPQQLPPPRPPPPPYVNAHLPGSGFDQGSTKTSSNKMNKVPPRNVSTARHPSKEKAVQQSELNCSNELQPKRSRQESTMYRQNINFSAGATDLSNHSDAVRNCGGRNVGVHPESRAPNPHQWDFSKEACCADTYPCEVCSNQATLMCSKCCSTAYCSETCATKDWDKEHYIICRMVQEASKKNKC